MGRPRCHLSDPGPWAKSAPKVGDEPPRYGYVSNHNTVFISLDQFNDVDFDGQGWFLANPTWSSGNFAEAFPDHSLGAINRALWLFAAEVFLWHRKCFAASKNAMPSKQTSADGSPKNGAMLATSAAARC